MRVAIVGIFGASALIGCASFAMGKNLQRESAFAIMPTPYPDSVKVSDVHSGAASATWVATIPSGAYDCSIVGDEHRALCVKRETPR